MTIPTVYMLIGMPASGKSTWAKENSAELNAVVLSSDDIRERLYGDASVQDNPNKIFEILYLEAKTFLKDGQNVIIDATNTSMKRRIAFIKQFAKYNKVAVYFNSSFGACVLRDKFRDRTVGMEVITEMYKNLQVPIYSEGWDEIKIKYDKFINPFKTKDYFEYNLINNWSYLHMFDIQGGLGEFEYFTKIYELPHDNPHHTFSVSRHTYYVYKHILENYPLIVSQKEFLQMLWVGVLHDIGKGFTKTFRDYKGIIKRTASFYKHENVSGQMACSILHALDYDDRYILEVVELINLHMRFHSAETQKSKDKLKNLVGEETYKKLEFLRIADTSAK